MINNAHPVNHPRDVATPSDASANVSQHRINDQSAAMQAALQVCRQYSRESKTQFRRECLDRLRASLVPAKDVSA